MCGICGQVSYCKNLEDYEESFNFMKGREFKRGLNRHGEYISEHAVMKHKTLITTNIERIKQPMTYAVGGEIFTICLDGELYNTSDLRNRIESRGYNFFSYSDTEAVLKTYCEYREKCVDILEGAFSFAVWEHDRNRLFVARDRIGLRPLYYYICDSGFIFASKIKMVLEHPEVETEMDANSLAELININYERKAEYEILKGIKEIKPAHCAYYDISGFYEWKYWEPKQSELTIYQEQIANQIE